MMWMMLAFRLNMTRYTLEVDTKPSEKGVMDLHQFLLSELEQVAFRGRVKGPNPPSMKTLVMSATTRTTTRPGDGLTADGGAGGAGKAAGTPCKFFLTMAARRLPSGLEKPHQQGRQGSSRWTTRSRSGSGANSSVSDQGGNGWRAYVHYYILCVLDFATNPAACGWWIVIDYAPGNLYGL